MPRFHTSPPYYSRTAENELAYTLSETAEYADPERTRDWLRTWLPDHERAEDPTRALLSALASARGIERAADELLRELVAAARVAEMSWTAVGNATAMTRQSAQQRWVRPGVSRLLAEPHPDFEFVPESAHPE